MPSVLYSMGSVYLASGINSGGFASGAISSSKGASTTSSGTGSVASAVD